MRRLGRPLLRLSLNGGTVRDKRSSRGWLLERQRSRRLPGVGLLSVCLVLASGGCRPSQQHERLPVYPVRGQVFYQGRPAVGALVRLHPLPPTPTPPFLPRGLVGADGSFTLTTYDPGDGAPAGDYAVSLDWRRKHTEEESEEGLSLLPARYCRPETSGLQVTIRPQEQNDLAPFQLK